MNGPVTLRRALVDFVGQVVDGSPSLAPRRAEAVALIDAMTEGWADRPPDGPPYASYLARDGTPFEPSVRISDAPSDLRWVLEAQPSDAARDVRAYWHAAQALDARLDARRLVDLTHARRIEDIFASCLPSKQAARWFGASLGPDGRAVLKHYAVVAEPWQAREAFARFGLATLAEALERTRPEASRVEFVSVDLTAEDPRLKLYVRHRTADPVSIDAAHALCPTWQPGDAATLLRTLFGAIPVTRKMGPISTFHVSLAEGGVTHSSLNVNLEPLHYRSIVPKDDAHLAARVAGVVAAYGLDVDPLYPRMLAIARRDGVAYVHHRYLGLQRRRDGRVEITVYLSTLLQALRHGLVMGPVRIPPAQLVRR